MFLAIQLASNEFQGAFANIVPQIATLFNAGTSGVGERVALAELQLVASPIEGDHFVHGGRVGATLARDICSHQPKKNKKPIRRHDQISLIMTHASNKPKI